MRKVEAIQAFLSKHTVPDLAALYSPTMEVQVNVAQLDGEPIQGEYRGRNWLGFSDGLNTWKPFRIPYNAMTEPEYDLDSPMTFSLDQYAEGIGMTGWDWQNRVSRWVAFDFDAILGHSSRHTSKLSSRQLSEIQEQALKLPWVTVRHSVGS